MNDFTNVITQYLDDTDGVRDLIISIAHDEGHYRKGMIADEIESFVIGHLSPRVWPNGYDNPSDMAGELIRVLIINNYINWRQIANYFIDIAYRMYDADTDAQIHS